MANVNVEVHSVERISIVPAGISNGSSDCWGRFSSVTTLRLIVNSPVSVSDTGRPAFVSNTSVPSAEMSIFSYFDGVEESWR